MKNWKEAMIAVLICCILFCGVVLLRFFMNLDLHVEAKSLLIGLLCGLAAGCLLNRVKKGILLAALSAASVVIWMLLPTESFLPVSSAMLGVLFSFCLCLIPFFTSLMVREKGTAI